MVCSLYVTDDYVRVMEFAGCLFGVFLGSYDLSTFPDRNRLHKLNWHPIQGKRNGAVVRESKFSYYGYNRRLKTIRVTFLVYTKSLFLV